MFHHSKSEQFQDTEGGWGFRHLFLFKVEPINGLSMCSELLHGNILKQININNTITILYMYIQMQLQYLKAINRLVVARVEQKKKYRHLHFYTKP